MTEHVWLRIIQINDVYELDNYPNFKTLVDEYKIGPDKTLIVLAGDFLGPSLLSSLDKGRGMVDTMMMCGFTHVCFGNHENDVPSEAIAQRIRQSNFVWLNTNLRELDAKLDVQTTPHDVVGVTHGNYTKWVGLLGLLTEDPSLYRPGSFANATIEPVLECARAYLKDQMPKNLDLLIPLTHQRMPEDRAFADAFTGDVFPIIVGGHDHEPYDETHSNARIIKTGYDGQNTAVIDIRWPIDGNAISEKPIIEVAMIPTTTFTPNVEVKARVDAHNGVLNELERAKLFRFEDWMDTSPSSAPFSTTNNRVGYSKGSEILVTIIRMGMRAQCGLLNAGSIRGNRVYDKDTEWFTWSDLKAEIPFPTAMVAVYIPGKVIEATIAYSRRGVRETPIVVSGGYIHTCNNIEFDDETQKIDTIRGEVFDRERLYFAVMPGQFFMGIDNHIPLLEWAKDKPDLAIDEEAGRPAKMAIVEMFSAKLWLEMGSFGDIDKDGDGVLTRDEVKARATEIFGDIVADLVVDNVMSVADLNHNGTISPMEMMVVQFVATDMLDHVCTHEELCVMHKVASEVLGEIFSEADVKRVVQELRGVLDISGDGRIDRDDAMMALGEIKRRSLLE